MDPATLAAVSIGTTLASGAISGIGAGMTGAANSAAFNYKAGIANLNSQIASQNAAWAIQSGGIKASNRGLQAGQAIGQTKTIQADSGIDVNSGTPAAVRDTQSSVAKYEQGIIRADAARTAYGYETKAITDTAEASLMTASGRNAKTAGDLGVLSSIIGTAGSVASKWSQANTLGIGTKSPGPIGTFDPDNFGAAPTWST